jgi:ABC-2 type transport system ATP-binding protein
MTAAIAVQNVVYTVRRHFYSTPKTIVHDLTFTVAPGEICGFVGANGAGKTTTMRMLLGQVTPTSGSLQLFGTPVSNPRARAGLGFLPERGIPKSPLSAHAIVRTHGLLSGLSRAEASRAAGEALERLGLGEQAHRPLKDFSKGMVQRVGLAQAIVGAPRLLILDEPLSGLDPPGRHAVRELIVDMGQRGCAVFFSTHILADVELICDRVLVLQNGQLTHQGPPAKLVAQGAERLERTEIIALDLDPKIWALAQGLGAHCRQFGRSHRIIANSLADANEIGRAILASGATLKVLAPFGGSPLEALLLKPQQRPPAP